MKLPSFFALSFTMNAMFCFRALAFHTRAAPRRFDHGAIMSTTKVSKTRQYATVPRRTNDKGSSMADNKEAAATVLGKFPFGKTISNKDKVFDMVDDALGVSKPPDIEVILTDHSKYEARRGIGHWNPPFDMWLDTKLTFSLCFSGKS